MRVIVLSYLIFVTLIFFSFFTHISADTFHNPNALKEFLNLQNKIKFGVQQRACSTCDWSISYPLESNFATQNLDSINIDSIKSPQNPANLNRQQSKNMEQVLQYSAMQDLFDTNIDAENDVNYEFLGQRNGGGYLDNLNSNNSLFQNPLNTQNTMKPQNLDSINSLDNHITQDIKLTKATFMKRNVASAYEQILKHKGVLTCMYCGDLDKVASILPTDSKIAKFHNVTYTFTPSVSDVNNALYRIDIADSACGIVDSLIFVTDKVSTQLFVYSRTRCKT
ncbi:hypothetical protein DCO58_02255 [Helicobacter saguini]|uniref:Uncharacterized protein n=1 Tax=Helicobacter saguini TaxID=1548018 RepID=A0A347VRR7_9HELI|nr:hypothetical protein [Helicobacter saguini]MWV62802.1 hypothetical protein [Helicobacter saguini]MWV66529.1 hypothetical protein [Helicobacter saguini]MWV68878.1 hypothetical protein [Helicobacter saguini]MWV71567.1 hypothetical protein [Helicobacter saguini]TLD93659.1 hypothetical protein LS64_008520 [Helicobacter saguini]